MIYILQLYSEHIVKAPEDSHAFSSRAAAYLKLNKYREALQVCEWLPPAHDSTYCLRAQICEGVLSLLFHRDVIYQMLFILVSKYCLLLIRCRMLMRRQDWTLATRWHTTEKGKASKFFLPMYSQAFR